MLCCVYVQSRLARSIEVKDAERTSIRVANSLEGVASLELLQAPGLPYQLPRALAGYPILAGETRCIAGRAMLPKQQRRASLQAAVLWSVWAAACERVDVVGAAAGGAGRAVVELTVEKATGEEAFVDQNSGDGPQKQTKLVMVLDGFSGQ